ncbi:transcription termination factor NusA [Chlamydiia bacterium]|nr:transcription termination factor NusA [Chlamydiia bacterium]
MQNKDVIAIFEYLEREKGIPRPEVAQAIADSLYVAAEKSIVDFEDIDITVDDRTGEILVVGRKEVVEVVSNPKTQISYEEAQKIDESADVGMVFEFPIAPDNLGRIAAQKARSIIHMKLKEAEKNVIYKEYRGRLKQIVSGTIKQIARNNDIIIDIGKVDAVMPSNEYIRDNNYAIGQRVSALLLEVEDLESGGARVLLSRNSPEFVYQLLAQEVPEVSEKYINVEQIVREPGLRSKIIVSTEDKNIDPVGTCVGVRGSRIKNVIQELNDEKIDLIIHTDDTYELLRRAMSPTQALRVKESEEEMIIVVDDEDYPKVIGKRGSNARLLNQLVDKDLSIQKLTLFRKKEHILRLETASDIENKALDEEFKLVGLNKLVKQTLVDNDLKTSRDLLNLRPEELAEKTGISLDLAEDILEICLMESLTLE